MTRLGFVLEWDQDRVDWDFPRDMSVHYTLVRRPR